MWGIYYNKLFNSIMGLRDQIANPIIDVQDNLTLIKNPQTQEVIGFNFFQVERELKLNRAFNSFNPQVLDFVQTKMKHLFSFSQEKQFVVGHVLECEKIKDTHLHKTKVNIGNDKILDIVCGAKNIAKDQFVVVALVGAWLPTGMQIVPGKLYGFESNGMICSAQELSIDDYLFNAEGIIELPKDYHQKVGEDFFALLNQE